MSIVFLKGKTVEKESAIFILLRKELPRKGQTSKLNDNRQWTLLDITMQSLFVLNDIKFLVKLLDKYSNACYNLPINNKHL